MYYHVGHIFVGLAAISIFYDNIAGIWEYSSIITTNGRKPLQAYKTKTGILCLYIPVNGPDAKHLTQDYTQGYCSPSVSVDLR